MTVSGLIDAFRPADGPPPRSLAAFIRWALRGAWPVLILSGVISALAGVLEVASALILGAVIDVALASDPATFFADNWLLLLGFAAFFLALRPITFGVSSVFDSMVVTPNVNPLVLSRLNRWTMGQSVTFFDNDFAGRIAQKQMQTSRALTNAVTEVIDVVTFAAASLLASVAFLIVIDGRIALMLAVWLVGYVFLIRAFLPEIRKRSKARAGARAMVSGQVVDTITNIKTVKLFARGEHEDKAALDAMGDFRDRSISFGAVSALFRFTQMTMSGALPVMLIGGTAWAWTRGAASAGDIAAAGAIAIRIAQMAGWVSRTIMQVYANIGEIEDGMRTLTPPHGLTDAPEAKVLGRVAGRIDFDDVSFAYGRQSGGIANVTLHIRPGEKVGIVGASGAGKSTLVALLLRLYDVEGGRVLIDGQDIRQVTQESLRRQIGMVTQETAMFNRSARDNILYGNPDAAPGDVEAAAKAAQAHEFILGLQDFMGREGYDAHLGERGVKLSGGQRQRIALARAFLKDAPILVLDEATSALDSEIEAQVQQTLRRLMQGKTVLAIAHRLSTIAAMDRIVVLDDGRIAEKGSHNDLLARGGLYARYWERQSGGFIGVEAAE
jgi:ATP-binding cassette, subfamily B, bacterial